MTDRLHITAEDVAARLQVSKTTLYRWIRRKNFPAGEKVNRTGMPGPRTTSLWDIRIVDQWAIDNDVLIRTDPTLPDRDYFKLTDDPAWVKKAKAAVYVMGAAAIAFLVATWVI